MKIRKIKDKIYWRQIILVYDFEDKELRDFFRKNYDVDFDFTGTEGKFWSLKKGGLIHNYIMINRFDWTIGEQALLSHEILHAVFQILDDVGFKYDKNGEEAYTYYFQYIFSQVWEILKNNNPKFKKPNAKDRNEPRGRKLVSPRQKGNSAKQG